MRHAPSTLHFSHAFRSRALPPAAIEWEELPSLAQRVRQAPSRLAAHRRRGTRPARPSSSSGAVSQPFREPLKGVAIREVNEPDVFRHFFGR